MAEIGELVNMDELKKMFPDTSDDIIKSAVEKEGLTLEEKAPEAEPAPESTPEQEKPEEEKEEVIPEAQEDPLPTPDKEKRVPLRALQEEREKRQKFQAQLAALQAELEKVKAIPQATPVSQSTASPATPQTQPNTQQLPSVDVAQLADKEVREKLKIPYSVDVDDLVWQTENPKEYRQYLKETAKAEYRLEAELQQWQSLYSENAKFAQTLTQDPLFQPVFNFIQQELDEMPRKQAKPIEEAYARINSGEGTKEDRALLQQTFGEYKNKFITLTSNPAVPNPTAPVAAATQDKISAAASHPRTGMLGGSASAGGFSEAEILRLCAEGKASQLPEDILQRVLQGKF
jgi:hypothetical protein